MTSERRPSEDDEPVGGEETPGAPDERPTDEESAGGETPGGAGLDEEQLRESLHSVAGGLDPAPNALSRLREAVPRRRNQKRTALVGAAAVLAVAATVTPIALRHDSTQQVADPSSSASRTAVDGGQGGDSHGGHSAPRDSNSPSTSAGGTRQPQPPGASSGDRQPGTGRQTSSGGATGAPHPPDGATAGRSTPPPATSSPDQIPPTDSRQAQSVCSRSDLSGGSASRDGSGGAFTLSNVSDSMCRLAGPGTVTADNAETAGGGDGGLMLAPGQSFTVSFQYVADGCDDDSDEDGEDGEDGEDSDSTAEGDGGSVTVTYVPAPGSPAAGSVTLPGGCGGTVQWSGPTG